MPLHPKLRSAEVKRRTTHNGLLMLNFAINEINSNFLAVFSEIIGGAPVVVPPPLLEFEGISPQFSKQHEPFLFCTYRDSSRWLCS